MSDWQDACSRLWGDEWIAPLSEVLAVNRRTVERWNAGDPAIRSEIAVELIRLGRRIDGDSIRPYGTILRRLANGETIPDIHAEMQGMKRAIRRYEHDISQYRCIAVLAGGRPPGND